MTLIFIQGHRVTGKQEQSHSVIKLHAATQIFLMDDYVREMNMNKFRKHGEYGLFEHLLFLSRL